MSVDLASRISVIGFAFALMLTTWQPTITVQPLVISLIAPGAAS